MAQSRQRPTGAAHAQVVPDPLDVPDTATVPNPPLPSADATAHDILFEAKAKLLEQLGGLGACAAAAETDPAGHRGLGNILGVGVGRKIKQGTATEELALRVYVQHKADRPADVDPAAAIPQYVEVGGERIPTDVVVMAPMQTHAAPGDSIGSESQLTGTFGALVYVRPDAGSNVHLVCVLSNVHVMGMDGQGNLKPRRRTDPTAKYLITAPGPAEAANGQAIGLLYDYIEPTFATGQGVPPTWSADAAVAWVRKDRVDPSRQGFDVKEQPVVASSPSALLALLKDRAVKKVGWRTKTTAGKVVDVGADMRVSYGPNGGPPHAILGNAILVQSTEGGAFSLPGDSGSLVFDAATNEPVALLAAGNGATTICCPLKPIVDEFRIQKFINSANWPAIKNAPTS